LKHVASGENAGQECRVSSADSDIFGLCDEFGRDVSADEARSTQNQYSQQKASATTVAIAAPFAKSQLDTVYLHTIYAAMADDFTQCMVSNSRMAARAITRRYDAYLRPHGVTATQLSLMGVSWGDSNAVVADGGDPADAEIDCESSG
jgi:hypothetical protein